MVDSIDKLAQDEHFRMYSEKMDRNIENMRYNKLLAQEKLREKNLMKAHENILEVSIYKEKIKINVWHSNYNDCYYLYF